MRKEYGVALRELFTESFLDVCPFFVLVKKASISTGVPGERAFCWRVSETLHMWVIVVPHQKAEAFTIELGWSRKGRFPQLAMRPSLVPTSDAGPHDEYLCRLGDLSRGQDWWWSIEELPLNATQDEIMAYIIAQTKLLPPEVARARVTPHVQEAVGEFERFGLPFLRTHAQPGAS
jgi:hypothetical protein